MKISVIVPVRNEESSIAALIESLLAQTTSADEIVITDGGSTDETPAIINKYIEKGASIHLISGGPALPGRGRNLAARNASGDWLACIDAGITAERTWLEELLKCAQRHTEAQVVFGTYKPVIYDYFTECAAITYLPPPSQPRKSIASCLVKCSAWEAVGGFREDLRSGEDLIFFRDLENSHIEHVFTDKAVVHWQIQPDLSSTFRRFVAYSRSGMKAELAQGWQSQVTRLYLLMALSIAGGWFWRPLLFVPLILLLLRAQRRIYRWYAKSSQTQRLLEAFNLRRILTVAGINFAIDVAMFTGVFQWLLRDRMAVSRQPAIRNPESMKRY